MTKRVFAVSAHPDDIEFFMAGTMILLRHAGYELHTMTIANGSCGTLRHTREEIIRIRREESRAAAAFIGAIHHDSLVEDMAIYFEPSTLARLAAVIREVAPEILLVLSPTDYMEDHQNASRLAVTAAFARGMPNFPTDPPVPAVDQEVTVYHCQPHGNCDPLGEPVIPGIYVDITGVLAQKRAMLAHHESQKAWLDESQGMDSYLDAMESLCRQIGDMSGRFAYAEGWRRRLHFGFCAETADPLTVALGALAWKVV